MDNKSNVTKSKSSNIAKNRNDASSPKGKKVKSSAEFQKGPNRLEKKRGVYVEKRTTNMNDAATTEGKTIKARSPKRLRRNKTEFLQSVLTILSKCTASTQHPDDNGITIERDGQTSSQFIIQAEKHVNKLRKNVSVNQNDLGVNTNESKRFEKLDFPKQKQRPEIPKYKSRILNKVLNNDEDFVVWKRKTNIVQTPSNYSNKVKDFNDNSRWSSLTTTDNIVEEKNVKFDDFHRSLSDSGVEEKKLLINETPTLVQIAKNKSEHKDKKAERGIYDFFVDLLETVYDENDSKDDDPPAKFEIEKNVADKLRIPREGGEVCHIVKDDRIRVRARSPSPTYSRCKWRNQRAIRTHMSRSRSPKSFRSFTRSIKSRTPVRSTKPYDQRNTFAYAEQFIKASPNSSVISPRKSVRTKRTLLNILKEQLMEDYTYEEPQSLYEALKIIAKNKRKAKVIQFDEPLKYTKMEQPKSECWKRRRVISSSGKTTKRKPNRLTSKSFNTNTIFDSVVESSKLTNSPSCFTKSSFSVISPKPRSVLTDYESDSFHSLEVEEVNEIGMDYDNLKDVFYTDRYSNHRSNKEAFYGDKSSRKSNVEVNSTKFHSADSNSLIEEPLETSDSFIFKSLHKLMAGH